MNKRQIEALAESGEVIAFERSIYVPPSFVVVIAVNAVKRRPSRDLFPSASVDCKGRCGSWAGSGEGELHLCAAHQHGDRWFPLFARSQELRRLMRGERPPKFR